jgi:hypothetical protein
LRRLRGPWLRIHRAAHEPLHFGRTGSSRFDDPLGRYGVLYAAETLDGAFVETFGRTPGINVVAERQLAQRSITAIVSVGPLRIVDLTGAGLARIGATGGVTAGPHAIAQQWSRELWAHRNRPDDILFRARHDPECISIAIFSRAARLIRAEPLGGLLDPIHRAALGATLRRYDFSLQPASEG